MSDRTCSEDGCDKPYVARGRCRKHYVQWYRSEGSGAGTLRVIVNDGACSIDDCDQPAKARGWCVKHWTRWSRHGDPLAPTVRFHSQRPRAESAAPRKPAVCAIADCGKQATTRGWCPKHYQSWRRHGDPEAAKSWSARSELCERCGKRPPMPGNRRFCSKACVRADSYAKTKLPSVFRCPNCGTEFEATSRKGRSERRCPDCADANRRAINARLYAEMSPERLADMRAKGAQWSREHPEYGRAAQHRRRARKMQAPAEDFLDAEIFERDGWFCGICDEPVDGSLRWPDPYSASLDHIVPLVRGGHHTRANAQLAHLTCNIRKGTSLGERSIAN
jgi:5-methylcytosine-specific restriction endonuclease McrA